MGATTYTLYRRGKRTLTDKYDIFYEDQIGESPTNFNFLSTPAAPFLPVLGGAGLSEAVAFNWTAPKDFVLTSTEVWVETSVFSPWPGDSLEAQLWVQGGSQFAICSNPYQAQGQRLYKFRFPRQELKSGIGYSLVFQRTGARHVSAYYKIMCLNPAPFASDRGWFRDNGVWFQHATYGPHVTLGEYRRGLTRNFQMSKRAQSATLDLGKNDVDGKFKEGKADVVFRNKDLFLDPNEGGNIELNRLMRISVIEDIQVVDTFDSVGGWSVISGSDMPFPTLNHIDRVEGNACFDIGTNNPNTSAFFGIEKVLPAGVDISTDTNYLSNYIRDLLLLEDATQVIVIEMGSDITGATDKYRWLWFRNDATNPKRSLINGWNELFFNIGNASSTFGTPNDSNIRYISVSWNADTFNTVVPVSDIKVDWWRIGRQKNLFTGYTNRLRPQMNISDRTLNVTLSDAFSMLKKKEVSLGVLTGKKVSEIIEALLLASSVDPIYFEIDDTDTTVLNTVTWDNVKVMSKLEECVDVGQHHHFVDGSGVYQFKSNQWLSDPTPDFTYEFDSNDMDDFNYEIDIKGISNHIRVKYPTDLWADVENIDSILKYDRRLNEIVNELMPSGGAYALGVAEYALDKLNNARGGAEFWIKNRFPDILDMGIGDIVSIYNPFTKNFDLWTVLGFNRKVISDGNHDLKVRIKEWTSVSPLTVWYDLQPFDYFIGGLTFREPGVSEDYEGQSFEVQPTTGELWHVTVGYNHNVFFSYQHIMDIYAVDGSDLPTGAPLASSEPLQIFGGSGLPNWTFAFTGSNRITLTAGTRYAWAIRIPTVAFLSTRFWGVDSNIYSLGKPFWRDDATETWTAYAGLDRWFSIRLKV